MMRISLRCTAGFILLICSLPSFCLTKETIAPPLDGIEIHSQQALGLHDLLGKIVLIDFWATWCIPCRQSFPYLNDLQDELKNDDFIVLGVNLDENSKDILKFTHRFPAQFLILRDVPEWQRTAYEIEGVPTSYLIDKKGKIVKKFTGFKKSEFNKIKQWVSTQ
ncbi:MAG: thiol-disulfide isomerase/thioredoxin [Psychromonas sp.]|jgi:thiol-disulfide isomerase/thioredoxin|uniref:TlpA family protein disulfide reductase n=1 Tax=Psychromonas sp. TaxID=1884585 RepID=UPI0039E2BC4F